MRLFEHFGSNTNRLVRGERRSWVELVSIVCGVMVSSVLAMGDEKNPHVWEPKTTSVAVFKNGLGFFMREGEVELHDGWCAAHQVPPATFGTLAIYAHSPEQLVDVVGSGPGETVDFDDIDAPNTTEAKRARLVAMLNLNVALTYKRHGKELSAAGKLLTVSEEFAVLESDIGTSAVPIDGLSRIQLADLPLRVHVSAEKTSPTSKARLGMAYLRKGIAWIPEYTFKMVDEDTGELTLRGTLVNEAEDLIHTDVNFVVGVPNFVHTEYLSPTAIGQAIRTIGANVAPPEFRSQVMSRAAIIDNASNFMDGSAFNQPNVVMVENDSLDTLRGRTPDISEGTAADYTVYTVRDLTVRRGEKAIVTLFKHRVPYAHFYRWTPPGKPQHFVMLQNTTKTAWTTGPCLALKDNQPLSEDMLRYTPIDGRCEFPVTTATNLAHERTESESARQQKAYQPQEHVFLDLVTIQGKLKLRSFEARAVSVVIEASVSGKPTLASDGGTLWSDPDKLVLRERAGNIRWEIKLEAGETKVIEYTYERYVPSN